MITHARMHATGRSSPVARMGLSQWQCTQTGRLNILVLSERALTFGIWGLQVYQKPSLVLYLAIETQDLVSFCSKRSPKKAMRAVQGQVAVMVGRR